VSTVGNGEALLLVNVFAVIVYPELITEKPPPTAALVPPPTNDAVIVAFVISATSTFWSMVTVKLLL